MRLIYFLPEGSAFRSQLQAKAEAEPRRSPAREPEPWQEYFGWSKSVQVTASVYSALLAVNGAKREELAHPLAPGSSDRRGTPLIDDD